MSLRDDIASDLAKEEERRRSRSKELISAFPRSRVLVVFGLALLVPWFAHSGVLSTVAAVSVFFVYSVFLLIILANDVLTQIHRIRDENAELRQLITVLSRHSLSSSSTDTE
ncbi:MAG: hypothetical protein KDA57_18520 [Planctomycetales bacterium]|nr:hypothetical protein [Planctomycetales bacterium]